MEQAGFNPCEGFGGFGTTPGQNETDQRQVSIPVRDLVVLEPGWRQDSLSLKGLVSIPVRDLVVLELSDCPGCASL